MYVITIDGKSLDVLVLLDSRITAFLSVAYQPSHLLGIFRGALSAWET